MRLLFRRRRRDAAIPTASMADIAFLLLIFFLVTTTIDVDTGIGMVLPPKSEEPPPPMHDRNLLAILVNDEGRLLVEQAPLPLDALRETVKQHVMNCSAAYDYGCRASQSVSPEDAVISIKVARATPYDTYIDVLDEVWMAYFEVWDREASTLGFDGYKAYRTTLAREEANTIRAKIPPQISIAEPDL